MNRHSWDRGREDLKNKYTEQEQCIKCGLYRFKALGIWMYSKEKTTDNNPLPYGERNVGCVDKKNGSK